MKNVYKIFGGRTGSKASKQRERVFNNDLVLWRKEVIELPHSLFMIPVYYQERGYIIDFIVGYAFVSKAVYERVLEGRVFAAYMKNGKLYYEATRGEIQLFMMSESEGVKWLVQEIVRFFTKDVVVNQGDVTFVNGQSFDLREENIVLGLCYPRRGFHLFCEIPLLAYNTGRKIEENWRRDLACFENISSVSKWNQRDVGTSVNKLMEAEAERLTQKASHITERFLGFSSIGRAEVGDGESGMCLRSGNVLALNEDGSPHKPRDFWEHLDWVRGRRDTRVSGIYHCLDGFLGELYTFDGVIDLGLSVSLYDAILKRYFEEEKVFGEVSWVTAYHRGELEFTIGLVVEMLQERENFRCLVCDGMVQVVQCSRRGERLELMTESQYQHYLGKFDGPVDISDLDVLTCACGKICVAIYELFEIGVKSGIIGNGLFRNPDKLEESLSPEVKNDDGGEIESSNNSQLKDVPLVEAEMAEEAEMEEQIEKFLGEADGSNLGGVERSLIWDDSFFLED